MNTGLNTTTTTTTTTASGASTPAQGTRGAFESAHAPGRSSFSRCSPVPSRRQKQENNSENHSSEVAAGTGWLTYPFDQNLY